MTNSHNNPDLAQHNPEAVRQRIIDAIKNSPQAIEQELAKPASKLGANAWLACYNSRLQLLYGLVDKAQGILPDSEIDAMVQKLGLIGTELAGSRDQQSNDISLSESKKADLLKKLDILGTETK